LLAAALLRKKIVLFEANCVMGKVNRFFRPFASAVAIQFPQEKKSLKFISVPMLPWTLKKEQTISSQDARKRFGLDPDLFTVLIFGGSQGASFFNREFGRAALLLKTKSIQFLHLTGKEEGGAEVFYKTHGLRAHVKSFESDMNAAYAAADLVVCRSGAGTVAELIRYKKPALLVPYPTAADDHQRKNGEYLARGIGGARLLLQQQATPGRIAEEIEALINEREIRMRALENVTREEKGDFASLVRAAARR
jgi:UDP-N-acetylglucosamine--N-acetylmuramyl-(pentapeptide) pyrophosphoryl-undecaprenol N-acetylglucosamine transferase